STIDFELRNSSSVALEFTNRKKWPAHWLAESAPQKRCTCRKKATNFLRFLCWPRIMAHLNSQGIRIGPGLFCRPDWLARLDPVLFRAVRGLPVASPDVVPPHRQDFHAHVEPVTERVDARGVIVGPFHRDLDRAQS